MQRPGYWGRLQLQWKRIGETVASIRMRGDEDRIVLMYRHRSGGADWKDEE
jgi:hypothetical protein